MKHGSLFSGIGGFDLGFERAGIETLWQVEIDGYCRRILESHFPSAKRYEDVRTVGKHNLATVDIISGGFPCQDISNAGKRAGIDGERSGLWSEYARIIRELRPRFVVVENVAALLGRGMERVLGDLAACGYDAEWQSIRASDVGAPHRRERIWIVAYAAGDLWRAPGKGGFFTPDGSGSFLAYATHAEVRSGHGEIQSGTVAEEAIGFRDGSLYVADSDSSGHIRDNGKQPEERREVRDDARSHAGANGSSPDVPDAIGNGSTQRMAGQGRRDERHAGIIVNDCGEGFRAHVERTVDWWAIEPDVGRVAHGIPARVDRLKGLGNAIVPQIAEWIGRRLNA